MNGIDPTPYCFLCLARGEVENMIKFQHEIGANSRRINLRLLSTGRAKNSPNSDSGVGSTDSESKCREKVGIKRCNVTHGKY